MIKNKETMEPRLSGKMEKVVYIEWWLLNFYPFYQSQNKPSSSERFIKREDFNQPIEVKDINNFPEDLIEVPLIMFNKLFFTNTELMVKTGILGMIKEKNGEIRPEIGYYIANKLNSGEVEKKFTGKKEEK